MQIIRVTENDTHQQMLQVNAAIATAKNFPKEGEFGCQHSVISPSYQILVWDQLQRVIMKPLKN